MSSFSYAGHSFEDYLSAELVEPVAHVIDPLTAKVSGRPGLVLLGGEVEPLELRLRVFLDAPEALSVAERSAVRMTLRNWLLVPGGGTLVVPGEPTLEWHDVVCAGVSDWDSLFADGSAVVTFECLDPIAYGDAAASADDSFTVGGTWQTWPLVQLSAEGGSSVMVADSATGAYVLVEREFAAGDVVVIYSDSQFVTVNGVDATADVALGSDFFSLGPGDVSLSFTACTDHIVSWRERWV